MVEQQGADSQCCPPTCGAAAAIVCSEAFAKANNLDTGVTIAGQAMTTDYESTFGDHDMRKLVAFDMAKAAAEKFILDGDNTYGGQCVTNPSGGLLSKGHPLGATGLAQCYELVNQLRGNAQARQVPGVNVALQHNLGLGGACVVTLYQSHSSV